MLPATDRLDKDYAPFTRLVQSALIGVQPNSLDAYGHLALVPVLESFLETLDRLDPASEINSLHVILSQWYTIGNTFWINHEETYRVVLMGVLGSQSLPCSKEEISDRITELPL